MKYILMLGLLIAGCQSGSPDLIQLTLEEKVIGEYNSTNYEDNGPQMGHKGEESHE